MSKAADTPRVTKASLALRRKFDARRGYAAALAKKLEVSASRMYRIAGGELLPRADEGAFLVGEGIPIAWWRVPAVPTNRPKRPKSAA